jgi:hypothetical protein
MRKNCTKRVRAVEYGLYTLCKKQRDKSMLWLDQ